ncbi:MAG: Lrp/AsnC family transcriptional regulator [Promethearchaeota archaeon]
MNGIKIKSQILLNVLYKNSMRSLAEIGKDLHMTRQHVATYLKRLKNDNIIYEYSIVENPNIQESKIFFIEIKTNPEEPEIVSRLEKIPSIRSIDGIIGSNSLIAKFYVRNDQEFNDILNQIDKIISSSRFQHYKIINCLKIFKNEGNSIIKSENKQMQKLDETDIQILKTLNKMGPKFSYKSISDKIKQIIPHITYAKVRRKTKYLIKSGIIQSFTIRLSNNFIQNTDFGFKFYLHIIPKNFSEYNSLALHTLGPKENITELYRTGQEYGLTAVVRTKNIPEYRNFIESLYKTGKIQDSFTIFVIDEKMPAIFKPFR